MRKAAAGLLIGACAAVIVVALTNLEALYTVELKTYDWRLSRTADPSTARKDIALVEIDEYSLRNLQQHAGRWPWPRVVHASLIDYLNRGKPKLIVYDVLFADEDLRVGFPYGGDTWSGRGVGQGARRYDQKSRERHPARRRDIRRRGHARTACCPIRDIA